VLPDTRLRQLTLALGCLCALLSAGCRERAGSGPEGNVVPDPRPGGTLVIAASADLRGVNPVLSDIDGFTSYLQRLLFLTLFEEQADYAEHPPSFRPRLAENWEWSEDHKTLTLHLRPGVAWSDGVPVTGEDVKWTWEMQTHPEVRWGRVESKDNIASIEVVDELTVRVHFKHESPSQLAQINEGPILPSHLWSELPPDEWFENATWFENHMLSSGPYLLQSWEPQQQIVLLRNDTYFEQGLPYIDRVVFRVVPDKSNQVRQLLSGDLDLVRAIPAADAAAIETSDRTRLLSFWHRAYNFIAWNLCRELFADRRVREALTLAIDRPTLVEAVLQGRGRVGASPIISTVWAADPDLEPLPYDPARAKELLAQAGWSDTDGDGLLDRDGRTMSFEIMTNSSSRVRVDAAVMIQEQLRRAGMEAKVRQMEFGTMISKSLAHEFDGVLNAWGIDPTLDLTYAFHSRSIEDGYNFGCYSNPQVDALIDQAEAQIELERKTEIVREIQWLLHEDQPYTILWEPQRLVGISSRLQDAQPNPVSSFYRLRTWWLLEGSS